MRTRFLVMAVVVAGGLANVAGGQDPIAELRVPVPGNAAVTFGPPGCPIMLVGKDAWHLKQGRIVRTLEGDYESRGLRTLSANGQYFAVGSKSPNQTDTEIAVWNIPKQTRVFTISGDKQKYVDILTFADKKTLVFGGRHSPELTVWDVEAGKELRKIPVPVRRISVENFTVSPDGKQFALLGDDNLVVCSLVTGKQVAALAPLGGPAVVKRPSPAKDPAGFQAALKKQMEARFTMAWMRGLTFSPDGQEIAAVSTHPHAHLMCWSAQGKLLLDEPLSAARLSVANLTLKWLPDGSGWLINGNLFDRASKQLVLSWRVPFARDLVVQPLDRDRLFGQFGDDAILQTLVVPWKELQASLDQMKRKAPAYLAPGQPVSVKIEITNARGNVQETEQLLREAVIKRLERVHIPVQDGQATTLVLRLAEREGDRLPIFERQSPFDFRGRDTGRTAVEAGGDLVIELVAFGSRDAIWRDTLRGSSARSFQEEINDQTVRKSMVENLSRQLTDLPMPYFLPKSPDVMALPAVVQ